MSKCVCFTLLIAILLLFAGTLVRADGIPQDTLVVTYGPFCTASDSCGYYADWSIVAPTGTLDLLGNVTPIASIPPPAAGVAFTEFTILSDPFNVNQACDATTNEFVCDLKTLGLYTNGAPIAESALPFFNVVSASQATFAPFVQPPPTSTPEPGSLSLLLAALGCGALLSVKWRRVETR
jgi:hypothetical protein